MGVSKESISKFLIGNRFHVKLRILSSYSNSKTEIYVYTQQYVCVATTAPKFEVGNCSDAKISQKSM